MASINGTHVLNRPSTPTTSTIGLVSPKQTVIVGRPLNDMERGLWKKRLDQIKRDLASANPLHDELIDMLGESLASASKGVPADLVVPSRCVVVEAFLMFILPRGLACQAVPAEFFWWDASS